MKPTSKLLRKGITMKKILNYVVGVKFNPLISLSSKMALINEAGMVK